MPLIMQYGKDIWKDRDYFFRGRAIGMSWEVGVARAMLVGEDVLEAELEHVKEAWAQLRKKEF